ncbi:MAG: siroheme synthase CysG [Pseudomonadota bacterium]
MRHFPVFINLDGRRVVVSGAGETAIAKLRLLLKTNAHINVIGAEPEDQVLDWARENRIFLTERAMEPGDAICASLFYAANDDEVEDNRVADIAHREGALVNIVDNLNDSQFITPAIVDRDPVTVAIGTEGAAPVLARKIKADLESQLPSDLGVLARIGQAFRARANMLPMGRKRRDFWTRFYFGAGARALNEGGREKVERLLEDLLTDTIERRDAPGHVSFVGAGPGDPDLLTMKARRALHEADVVLHDRLVPSDILELARREATIIETGKKGFGEAWKQDDINALMIEHARAGAHIVRLKSGDPLVYGRLDEETDALAREDIAFDIVPGITAASAAAASTGKSLTKRGRNSSLRFVTAHDMDGFADHDWQSLAKPGAVTAVYMGVKAAPHVVAQLLAHGAAADTPVTVIENVSRASEQSITCALPALPKALAEAKITGPAVILLGLGDVTPEAAVTAKEIHLVEGVA